MNFEFTNQAIDFIQQALSQHDSKSYRILIMTIQLAVTVMLWASIVCS